MIGMGSRSQALSDNEAKETAPLWGTDPVHPSSSAYKLIAECLERDASNAAARYVCQPAA